VGAGAAGCALGQTLLAVGDVHGCIEALDAMLATLAAVIDEAQARGRASSLIRRDLPRLAIRLRSD
jgi:hypothetical protein